LRGRTTLEPVNNMHSVNKRKSVLLTVIMMLQFLVMWGQERTVIELSDDWKFHQGELDEAYQVNFDDRTWQGVTVPHDWAIYGPFDEEVDKQYIAVEQNLQTDPIVMTGRTGALPFIGEGWYRKHFRLPGYEEGQKVLLTFDGAMSEPEVFLNGRKIGEWNYGYSYFYFDITEEILPGEENVLAVKCSNMERSSRWYPGAGLYRKVQIIMKSPESVDHWGTYITTPFINREVAKVKIRTRVSGSGLSLVTRIVDPKGKEVAADTTRTIFGNEFEQNIPVADPMLWSPETPHLYIAVIEVYKKGHLTDRVKSRFGIREISYTAEQGFRLNGESRKFKGVCLHHDLGPLGSAINASALRRQLRILKDLGCNAIRSAHNMPSHEQLELCDEMGFLFLAESFDEWAIPKVKNGYNRFFETDVEQDIVNLVRATRNHPSIVMWSAGNEVPDQRSSEGVKRAKQIMEIFHREDPTRPVTVGMDQVENSMRTGFGAVLDVPGLNYRTHLYQEAYEKFPQGFLLGSETASTVSSRGVYHFPVEKAAMKKHEDGQSSSYDLEYCFWSNLPDDDFALQDDHPWVIGEFVWTGFDYLGEPTPYDTYWPSRSSYFGILDLAGIPKDRYYLYRSRWNREDPTLHILPHWTWPGREGEKTPVFVYTSYDSAELFVNGKSQGIRSKSDSTLQHRYRLMWMDVTYEPGTLRAVAYDREGREAEEAVVVTAGKPDRIILEPDRTQITADGSDLSFITVSVVDRDGNPCPTASQQLNFKVTGEGTYRAACNGDPTSLEIFHLPAMKLFSGKLVVLVQSTTTPGTIQLSVNGKGLKEGSIELQSVSTSQSGIR